MLLKLAEGVYELQDWVPPEPDAASPLSVRATAPFLDPRPGGSYEPASLSRDAERIPGRGQSSRSR
jgi:hypothetical protein